eukprot:761551-Hanusia_phi.AAC.6
MQATNHGCHALTEAMTHDRIQAADQYTQINPRSFQCSSSLPSKVQDFQLRYSPDSSGLVVNLKLSAIYCTINSRELRVYRGT